MLPVLAARSLDAWIDPATVFAGGPADAADAFWLDAGPEAADGWSWLGEGARSAGPAHVVCAAQGRAMDAGAGLPGAFHGGWIGWLGYDDAAARAGAPAAVDGDGTARWLAVDRFVAFDHSARQVWAVAPADDLAGYAERVADWARRGAAHPRQAAPARGTARVRARHSAAAYAELIERCRDAIRAGDAYQLCLTTRFEVTGSIDPVAAFLALREATPSHHAGFIRAGDLTLVSASPERFLQIADGIVRTHPIKGTRPRGAGPAADAALAAELLASAKERAENVMIVDLMRNDLQRVCLPGTVAAEALLQVESYPAVHQLVSSVGGRLRPGIRFGDIIDAAFPAGSMTGAPKLSAMTILHRLENGPRGVFAGAFGWVGADGAADLAMVIRSIVVHPGGAYVGAGGGITWGSEPAAEVAEVALKARAPLAALGAALPPDW
ncbi:aminodeoxychorismate synthase component I [Microbacterium sp. MC2]